MFIPLLWTLRFNIVRQANEIMQSQDTSYVAIVLFLNTCSYPVIVSVMRELSKCMDSASIAVSKEMLMVTKFKLDSECSCLKTDSKAETKNWDFVP